MTNILLDYATPKRKQRERLPSAKFLAIAFNVPLGFAGVLLMIYMCWEADRSKWTSYLIASTEFLAMQILAGAFATYKFKWSRRLIALSVLLATANLATALFLAKRAR